MRTRIYKDSDFRAHFRWPLSEFKTMRACLMGFEQRMDSSFIYRLVDAIDEIKELPVGGEMFIVCAKWDCLHERSLHALNERVNARLLVIEKGYLDSNYTPFQSGLAVKRTEKNYSYRPIEAE